MWGGCPHPPSYFCYFLISNQKLLKPAVTVGTQEKWKFNLSSTDPSILPTTFVSKIRPIHRAYPRTSSCCQPVIPASFTTSTIPAQPQPRKTWLRIGNLGPNRYSSA